MSLETNDLMALKSLNDHGMTPYEQFKVGHMQRKASGTAIAGLVVGVSAAVLAIGAAAWAGSRAKAAKDIANAKVDGLKDLVQSLASTLAAERNERISGDFTLNQTITDTVSGSQQGTLSAQQQAVQTAEQTVLTGLMTGQYSENPQKVMLYSAPQPCGCPGSCGS